MRALRVVPGNEERDRQRAFGVGGEVIAVRAFALDRADETLSPPVGPGMARSRAGVPDARAATGVAEGEALVRRSVVAEHALDAQPAAREERTGTIEESRSIDAAEGWSELAEHQP